MSRGTVLVTDAEGGAAIAIIRSLGRAGWNVIAASSDAASPGFRSRHARGRLVYPPPSLEPARFVAAIERAVRLGGVNLVVPVSDATLVPLAFEAHRFLPECRVAAPGEASLDVVLHKGRTLELARRLGIDTGAHATGSDRR